MDHIDLSNLGRQVLDTVQEAIDSMHFEQLNQDINRSVNQALGEARKQMDRARKTAGGTFRGGTDSGNFRTRPDREENRKNTPFRQESTVYNRPAVKKGPVVRAVGRVSGTLYTIFGAIGTGAMGLTSLILGGMALASGSMAGVRLGLYLFLPLTCVFAVMLVRGTISQRRLRRMRRYLDVLDGKPYGSVKEIAEKTHVSVRYVRRDLKKMIAVGMFPEGHLDEEGTCLMLDDESFDQYRLARESRQERERQEEAASETVPEEEKPEEMIREGERYLRELREANDAIPGEVISAKLDRLELIIRKIFEVVGRHPRQKPEMEKFMEYYLPTTVKLVNAYREFDSMPVQGENIMTAKTEIEGTLDTINSAFEQLLDDMFQDAAMDVSADITVLETMFAREGYKEKDFK